MKKLFLFFIFFLANFSLLAEKPVEKKIRVTSVFFPTDNGRWTDQILSSFHRTLVDSSHSFQFSQLSYDFIRTKEKNFLEEVKRTQPDFVFLPDDFIYKKFAPPLYKETGATILFVSIYENSKSLFKNISQRGVYCEAPMEELLKKAASILGKKPSGVSFVGGSFAGGMASSLGGRISLETKIFTTNSWTEYQKRSREAVKKGHLVFTLAPFDVRSSSGKLVSKAEFSSFLDELEGKTLGYGNIESYRRTFSLGVDPKVLGSQMGSLFLKTLKSKEKSLLEPFSSFEIKVDEKFLEKQTKKNKDILIF